jgi:hypothetical protein
MFDFDKIAAEDPTINRLPTIIYWVATSILTVLVVAIFGGIPYFQDTESWEKIKELWKRAKKQHRFSEPNLRPKSARESSSTLHSDESRLQEEQERSRRKSDPSPV